MDVFLETQARLTILFAAIEAFKKESAGLLLGHRTLDGNVVVRVAIPYQTAERSFGKVHVPRKESHLKEMLPAMPVGNMEYVGGFHSHPSWGNKFYPPKPGDDDEDWICGHEPDIELIVSLKEKKRSVSLASSYSGGISGTVGRYYYRIAGYYCEDDRTTKAFLLTGADMSYPR